MRVYCETLLFDMERPPEQWKQKTKKKNIFFYKSGSGISNRSELYYSVQFTVHM